ncbi:hypothetical protein T4B_2676, partial [Trichinella pseudospiralis]
LLFDTGASSLIDDQDSSTAVVSIEPARKSGSLHCDLIINANKTVTLDMLPFNKYA